MTTIFLSYSRLDADAVRALKATLKQAGHDVWVDVAGLPEASLWREEIALAIERRDVFLFAVSHASLRSSECRKEFEHARNLSKRIIPVVIDDAQPSAAPPDLADINWIPVVAHERIEKAISTDPAHLQQHTRFLIAAREWKRNQGGVLRGASLAQAERWVARAADKEPLPTDQHLDLIAASVAARKRRRIWTAIGAVVFVAAIITIVVVAKKRAASERMALANRLAGESIALWNNKRFDESMLRAVAAYQAAPTSRAFSALLHAAQAHPQLEVALHGHRTYVDAVAFDPRGGRFVSAGEDHALHVFDTATWKPIATIPAGTESISQLVFAPDGSFLLSAGWDGMIHRWDVAAQKELGPPLHMQRGIIEALALHPGKRFVAAGYSHGAFLWDLAGTPPTATELPVSSKRINGVAFSGDGTALAVIEGTTSISAWTFADGRLSDRRDSGNLGASITALASHGDAFVAGLSDGTILWLRADNLLPRRRLRAPGNKMILALALSDDGRWLASGSNEVLVWREDRDTPDVIFPARDRVFALAFQPGTARVAASGADPAIYVLDPKARQPLAEVVHRVRASIRDLAVEPDGASLVFTTLDDERFRLQLPSRESETIEYTPLRADVTSAADGPNGTYVTATKDGVVTVKRAGATTVLSGVKLSWVMNILFSPRGDLLLVGDNEGRIAAWDAKSLAFLRSWNAREAAAAMAFSPNGKQLAVVDAGTATITLIDPYGTAVTTFEGECERVFSVAYVADGRKLVTGCNDGSLEVLDTMTRERLGVIPDNEQRDDPDYVNALSRHPRGDLFVAGTEDGRIMLWRLDPGFWLRRACRRANRDLQGDIEGWSGAPLLPCSMLLKDAPPDPHRPDVEEDENAFPRVPLNIASLNAFQAKSLEVPPSGHLQRHRMIRPRHGFLRQTDLIGRGVSGAVWAATRVRRVDGSVIAFVRALVRDLAAADHQHAVDMAVLSSRDFGIEAGQHLGIEVSRARRGGRP